MKETWRSLFQYFEETKTQKDEITHPRSHDQWLRARLSKDDLISVSFSIITHLACSNSYRVSSEGVQSVLCRDSEEIGSDRKVLLCIELLQHILLALNSIDRLVVLKQKKNYNSL